MCANIATGPVVAAQLDGAAQTQITILSSATLTLNVHQRQAHCAVGRDRDAARLHPRRCGDAVLQLGMHVCGLLSIISKGPKPSFG